MKEIIKVVASERYKALCGDNDRRYFEPIIIRYRDLETCTYWLYHIDSLDELNEFLSTFDYKKNIILGFKKEVEEDDTSGDTE